MKKKYLFLVKTGGMGGAEFLLLDYFQYINYDHYSVVLASSKDPYTEYLNNDQLPVEVIKLPSIENSNSFFSIFKTYFSFFKNTQPDNIVINQFELQSFSLPEFIAAFIYTKGNVQMILHSYPFKFEKYKRKLYFGFIPSIGFGWKKRRLFQRLLINFCKVTLVVSSSLKDALIDSYGYPSSKIEVINHGVETKRFSPSSFNASKVRSSFHISSSDLIFISTSRLAKIKKIERILNAFVFYATTKNNMHLFIVGTGAQESELKYLVSQFSDSVKKRIYFLGFQNNVEQFLQASDVYLLSSDYEGFSIACLEAMSCGLIPIVTNCGGPTDFIINNKTGFLVDKSLNGIKEGFEKVLNLDIDQKISFTRDSRHQVVKNYELKTRVKYALNLLGLNDEDV